MNPGILIDQWYKVDGKENHKEWLKLALAKCGYTKSKLFDNAMF